MLQTCGRLLGLAGEAPPDGALVVSQKRSYMDRERTQESRDKHGKP
jgi:hypothetical protein